MFKLETKDDTECEDLVKENLICPIAGIIYRVEDSHANFRTARPKHVGLKPNVLSVWTAIIIKDAQIKRKSNQNVPVVKGHMLHPAKGVQHTKKQAFRQHVADSQKSYASILSQNSTPPQPQDKTFTSSDEQPVKFIANVALQVAQSHSGHN